MLLVIMSWFFLFSFQISALFSAFTAFKAFRDWILGYLDLGSLDFSFYRELGVQHVWIVFFSSFQNGVSVPGSQLSGFVCYITIIQTSITQLS